VSRLPIETSRSSPFNDELGNRNIEFTQINNDLTNLLATINVGVVMLGNDLTIRRFTPPAQKIFNLLPTDVGRPFGNINPRINGADLQAIIAGVLENLFAMEKEVTDQEGNSYLLQVLSYRTAENRIDGVVITVLDSRLRATSPLRKDAAHPHT
jgi:two-component system, chemotaxis family, CheB/CheR fusion protein